MSEWLLWVEQVLAIPTWTTGAPAVLAQVAENSPGMLTSLIMMILPKGSKLKMESSMLHVSLWLFRCPYVEMTIVLPSPGNKISTAVTLPVQVSGKMHGSTMLIT